MSPSKSKSIQYSPPLIVPPLREHKQTLIILHGRGSTAQKFADPLLQHQVPPLPGSDTASAASSMGNNKSFRDNLPHTKSIFPTAPLRRAVVFNRSLTHQWFDTWSLTQPEVKQDLQVQGLRETINFIHNILNQEIEIVGSRNVVLMGLSQGCAASIVATMLWRGEPFGAVVGMCGYLPFRKDMHDQLESSENARRIEHGVLEEEDDDDIFEKDPGAFESGTKLERAIDWLQEELQYSEVETRQMSSPSIQSIPVFMGHGTDDEKVPIQMGRLAADFLTLIGVSVTWKQYEKLDHWYSGTTLQDMVQFLYKLEG